MARAKLIRDDEFEREYQIPNGQLITLKLDEDFSQITFWDAKGKQLGSDRDFIFEESDSLENKYLLARMFVPIKNAGLGRAALELFRDKTGAIVFARPPDGIRRDDGSHLTEDAPGFVMRMQEEGLIESSSNENDYDWVYGD